MPATTDPFEGIEFPSDGRWLVTGAAGFIGSHLTQALLERGQSVVALDNFATGHAHNLDRVRASVGATAAEHLTFIEGDIRDRDACATAVKDCRYVLHQAALGSVPRSIESPHDSHTANVDGFVNVALAAIESGVESIVYASSSSVYGDDPKLPKSESGGGDALSPYAATKQIDELYAKVFARCYKTPLIGLRYFNVVGPRQDPNGPYAAVVPRWLAAFAAGKEPVIYGDGETSRDFCPIDNVVEVNLRAAIFGTKTEQPVFNVAIGDQTSLNQLYEMLRDGMAERGAPCADMQPIYEDFRAGDIRHSLADVKLARTELGYRGVTSLQRGLDLTMDAFVADAT